MFLRVRSRSLCRLLVGAVILLFPCSPLYSQAELENLVEQSIDAVVMLSVDGGRTIGSGFFGTSDGILITNRHVVDDAHSLTVTLSSGDVYDTVSLLAVDQRRDIAILRVPGFGLPVLPLGNSDSLRLGADVVVIGSPLGLENTVSTGIVSGKREMDGYHLLQITAPVSPGSSGGPVLSRDGEVVAITVAQLKEGQNLNFAIPINYARGLLSEAGHAEPLAVYTGGLREDLLVGEPTSGMTASQHFYETTGFTTYEVEVEEQLDFDVPGQWGEKAVMESRVTMTRVPSGEGYRIERYSEGSVRQKTAALGRYSTVQEFKSRDIADASDLSPIESYGSSRWWDGTTWRAIDYEVQFTNGQAQGFLTDDRGRRSIRTAIKQGVVQASMTPAALAFRKGELASGQEYRFSFYDPGRDEFSAITYRVLGTEMKNIRGSQQEVLRVERIAGLEKDILWLRAIIPRVWVGTETARETKIRRWELH